jgi:hypothetical protein
MATGSGFMILRRMDLEKSLNLFGEFKTIYPCLLVRVADRISKHIAKYGFGSN